MDAQRLVGFATIGVPAAAGVTFLTIEVRLDRTPIAGMNIGYPRTDIQDLHAQFMTRNARITEERHFAQIAGDVGAADADLVHPDQRLARPRFFRPGNVDTF